MAFTIYIHGENSYNVAAFTNIDRNTSEVNLSDLTEADYTKWTAIKVLGLDEEYTDAVEKVRYMSSARDYSAQIVTMKLNMEAFKFPADYANYKAIIDVLNMKYKYLHKGDYPAAIHADGKAICIVKGGRSWEHNYDNGEKSITQEIERMYVKNG